MTKTPTEVSSETPGAERPPGPGWFETVKLHLQFGRDQIGTYRGIDDKYGPVSRFRLGPFRMILATDPDFIEEVLLRRAESFDKDAVTKELSVLLGRGLIVSDGAFWRGQRKKVAPPLRRKQIAHYADIMVSQTEQSIAEWEEGEVRDFERATVELALRIVVQALFDLDVEERLENVAEAVEDAMVFLDEMKHSLWRYVPDPIPTPASGRFDRAKEELDTLIYDIIESRREGEPGDDLLYRLIEATDEDGERMSDEQLRDEVITLFLAGHETTGLTLAYALYLLTEHPAATERLYAEVDDVLGEGRAGADDLPRLDYTAAVVRETMRLYPPAWIVGREATEDLEIDGWSIPEGTQILLPQVLVHRDERWYDDPDAFRPQRWLDGLADELPRFAYFPFGGGPRICVGNHFARMETVLVLATLVQHCAFENVSPNPLETYTSVTLRPETSIKLKVSSR